MDVFFSQLYQASKQCRRGKAKGSQGYEANLLENLLDTQAALLSYARQPLPMGKFVAVNGKKPREIHSPAYAGRVVHHWFVTQYPNPQVYVQKGRRFVNHQQPKLGCSLGHKGNKRNDDNQ